MRKKQILLTLAGMMIGLTGCGAKGLALVSDHIEVELGSDLDETVTKYVELDETAAAEASVDFSAVDIMKVGTYTATVTYEDQTADFEVAVTDTTAPVVEAPVDLSVAVGEPLYVKDIITDITELSGNVKTSLSVAMSQPDGDVTEETESVETATESVETEATERTELPPLEEAFKIGDVTCANDVLILDEIGEYDLSLTVTDDSGNSAVVPVHVMVGEAPTLSGVKDMSVALGTEEVDYLEGVTATDCSGNDITANIVCDSATVNLETAGEYAITFTVTDANGFTATQTATVTVAEKNSKDTKKNDSKTNDSKTDSSKKSNSGSSGSSSNSSTNNSSAASAGTSGGNNASSGNSNSASDNSGNDSNSGNSNNASGGSSTSGDSGNSGNSGSTSMPTTPSTDNGGSASAPSTPVQETPSADTGSSDAWDPYAGIPQDILDQMIPWNPDEAGCGEDLSAGDGTSVWN